MARRFALLAASLAALTAIAVNVRNTTSSPPTSPPDQVGAITFSTYLGGSQFEQARDVATDSMGNIYIVGGSASRNFPVTVGPAFNVSSCRSLGSAGQMDVFIAKLSPAGELLWSRLLGGPCYDRAYAVEVDAQGFIYVAGRAGEGFPTTPATIQPNFGGQVDPPGAYGSQDGFVAKLAPDAQVVWATYFGSDDLSFIRDLDIDASGNVYIAVADTHRPNLHVTADAFQRTPRGANDLIVAKISADGARVLWASFLGGSKDDGGGPSLRVGSDGSVYVATDTSSLDLPTSSGAYQRALRGDADFYLARFAPDGSNLIFSTYLGGSGLEGGETHHLALDPEGNAYLAAGSLSNDFPTTSGAFQASYGGGSDSVIAKISPTGQLLASTYVGGRGNDGTEGVIVDQRGDVVFFGATASDDFPASPGAPQTTSRGGRDAIVVKLSPDLTRREFATYFGGTGNDEARSGTVDANGDAILVGLTSSDDWPVRAALQAARGGDADVAIAKLAIGSRTAAPPPQPQVPIFPTSVAPTVEQNVDAAQQPGAPDTMSVPDDEHWPSE